MRQIDADALIKETTEVRCVNCDRRKGMKKGKMTFVYEIGDVPCRACDVMDMIDALEEAPTVGGWISVKDRLPESNEAVLVAVYDSDGQVYHTIAVHYPCGDWDSDDDYFNMSEDKVMYWMPFPTLPEPPEEVSRGG